MLLAPADLLSPPLPSCWDGGGLLGVKGIQNGYVNDWDDTWWAAWFITSRVVTVCAVTPSICTGPVCFEGWRFLLSPETQELWKLNFDNCDSLFFSLVSYLFHLTQLETGAVPADHCLLPAHRALWSECPSEEDWLFRHFSVRVQTSWPNPRPRPSVLPKIYRETSADMAASCWSVNQAVGLGRRSPLDGWICGINWTEDLTCTAVDG